MFENKKLLGEVEYAPEAVQERAHARYMQAKQGREEAMDAAYDAYLAGTQPWESPAGLVWEAIHMKAATQPNLKHHRAKGGVC